MGEVSTIVIIVVLLYLISTYWRYVSSKNVFINIDFDKFRIIEGEKALLITEVVNRKFLPLPIIKFNMKIPIQLHKKNYKAKEYIDKTVYLYTFITSLISFQKVKKKNVFVAEKRGYYILRNIEVELIDLFGKSRQNIKFKNTPHMIVHPKPENLGQLIFDNKSLQGEQIVRRWIMPDPILCSGVRQYNIGDSFKDIDWKATAKLGELYVKKYEYTSDPSLIVLIDVLLDKRKIYFDEQYVDKAVKIAASIAKYTSRLGIPFGLATNAFVRYLDIEAIMPDTGSEHLTKTYDLLACISPHPNNFIRNIVEHYYRNYYENNTFIFMVYKITEETYELISNISRHNKIKLFVYNKSNVIFNNNVEIFSI